MGKVAFGKIPWIVSDIVDATACTAKKCEVNTPWISDGERRPNEIVHFGKTGKGAAEKKPATPNC